MPTLWGEPVVGLAAPVPSWTRRGAAVAVPIPETPMPSADTAGAS